MTDHVLCEAITFQEEGRGPCCGGDKLRAIFHMYYKQEINLIK